MGEYPENMAVNDIQSHPHDRPTPKAPSAWSMVRPRSSSTGWVLGRRLGCTCVLHPMTFTAGCRPSMSTAFVRFFHRKMTTPSAF